MIRTILALSMLLVIGPVAHGATLGPFRLALDRLGRTVDDAIVAVDDEGVKAFVALLETQHLSGGVIDDDRASRILDRYLSHLDPQRQYLLASDVAEWNWLRTELDDRLRSGDLSFVVALHDRYRQRVAETVASVETWLESDLDFTRDETIAVDRSAAPYPASLAERSDLLRRRVKLDLLEADTSAPQGESAVAIVANRYREVARRVTQTSADEVRELFLTAVAETFDPYSSFLSAETLENFQIAMRLQLQGIGAELESRNGLVIVRRAIPGGAAAADGRLQPGDAIVAVAQADGDFVDIVEVPLMQAVKLIRGPKGSTVRLRVRRDGHTSEIGLVRQQIRLEDGAARGEVVTTALGRKVGVIELSSFYRDNSGENPRGVTDDVAALIEKFRAQGISALVIDLRTNGGGALSEAIRLSGLFIDTGSVVQVKSADGIEVRRDETPGVAWSGPLVVRIGAATASAAEIFAAAVRDHGRGVLVGGPSFGKGTVQSLVSVPGGGALKLTTAVFHGIDGASTQQRGVTPDLHLPSIDDHRRDRERDRAGALSVAPIPPVDSVASVDRSVTSSLVGALAAKSEARQASSEALAEVRARIAEYLARRDRSQVPLQRERYTNEWQPAASVDVPGDDSHAEEILAIVDDLIDGAR